jgi:hypothetical protein
MDVQLPALQQATVHEIPLQSGVSAQSINPSPSLSIASRQAVSFTWQAPDQHMLVMPAAGGMQGLKVQSLSEQFGFPSRSSSGLVRRQSLSGTQVGSPETGHDGAPA